MAVTFCTFDREFGRILEIGHLQPEFDLDGRLGYREFNNNCERDANENADFRPDPCTNGIENRLRAWGANAKLRVH